METLFFFSEDKIPIDLVRGENELSENVGHVRIKKKKSLTFIKVVYASIGN